MTAMTSASPLISSTNAASLAAPDKQYLLYETADDSGKRAFSLQVSNPANAKGLQPGVYGLAHHHMMGPIFVPTEISDEKLIDVGGVGAMLLSETKKFFTLRSSFKRAKLPHKRGFILHGLPGCGKTSALRLLEKAFVEETGGYVLVWNRNAGNVGVFYKILRAHEPEKPLLIVCEDIDNSLSHFEVHLLEFLDGQESLDNVVVVATTNNLSVIPDRIKKRPSRIDRLIEVTPPQPEERRLYLRAFNLSESRITRLVKVSNGMTFAQVKELYISVELYQNSVKEAAKMLRGSTITAEELAEIEDAREEVEYDD
jgi:SpoVK/Ycf46/Vps4 family AAA+-type ATPase